MAAAQRFRPIPSRALRRRFAMKELDHFLQAYAAERAKIEARKKGYSVTEQSLQDGSIKLTIQVTGGAA